MNNRSQVDRLEWAERHTDNDEFCRFELVDTVDGSTVGMVGADPGLLPMRYAFELLEALDGIAEYMNTHPLAKEDQELQNHLIEAGYVMARARGQL